MRKVHLVIDPCYLMPAAAWKRFGEERNYKAEPDKPYRCSTAEKEPVLIVKTMDTPNGDGISEWNGERIAVDSGMLCVAEVEAKVGQGEEFYSGAIEFETRKEALEALPQINELF